MYIQSSLLKDHNYIPLYHPSHPYLRMHFLPYTSLPLSITLLARTPRRDTQNPSLSPASPGTSSRCGICLEIAVLIHLATKQCSLFLSLISLHLHLARLMSNSSSTTTSTSTLRLTPLYSVIFSFIFFSLVGLSHFLLFWLKVTLKVMALLCIFEKG